MTGGVALALLLLEMALLCAALLVPVALVLKRAATLSGRRAPALALHRLQRAALDRDAASGLLDDAGHRDAALEIDRRLLAEAAGPEPSLVTDRPLPRVAVFLLLLPIPVLAVGLYAIGGHPFLPAQPLANRIAAGNERAQEDARLVAELRDTLSRQDPNRPETRQGYLLLAQTEAARGDWGEAAAAWRTVLAGGFDPVIAVEAAEAQCRADNAVSPASVALFRRALAEGSKDASWRSLAEQRIAQFEHAQDPH
ncbi:c-type cytochrome biogenesis protein CcmI [Acetobacteraceae bacterium KSS8]|uniref:C-type cytochrome biogenesis protein CcmI n=1 Tax=Endosaccharibacter trunci TaxID=2812733 RepID=A0ABT1W236_9PROT|nr:c-type cytochrome biogenesis protein CcmI [Acetobacteraceae bacterium KSS8]